MAKLPEPPAASDLALVAADTRLLSIGTLLWRVYFRGGRHPTLWDTLRAFGPTDGRFDHHLDPPALQQRKILYAAADGKTCLAEVFQATRLIDRSGRDPWLVGFALANDVELLDLSGSWPTRAGASMAINSGSRPRARRWARAIYDAYPQLAGLYYCSSMQANAPAVALTDRAVAAIPQRPRFHRPLRDPALLPALSNAAADLGYGLV